MWHFRILPINLGISVCNTREIDRRNHSFCTLMASREAAVISSNLPKTPRRGANCHRTAHAASCPLTPHRILLLQDSMHCELSAHALQNSTGVPGGSCSTILKNLPDDILKWCSKWPPVPMRLLNLNSTTGKNTCQGNSKKQGVFFSSTNEWERQKLGTTSSALLSSSPQHSFWSYQLYIIIIFLKPLKLREELGFALPRSGSVGFWQERAPIMHLPLINCHIMDLSVPWQILSSLTNSGLPGISHKIK